jgi:hypothetical protein
MNLRAIEHNNTSNKVSKRVMKTIGDISLLRPQKGDILLLNGTFPTEHLAELAKVVDENNEFRDLLIIVMPPNASLEAVDEKYMNKEGWYKYMNKEGWYKEKATTEDINSRDMAYWIQEAMNKGL